MGKEEAACLDGCMNFVAVVCLAVVIGVATVVLLTLAELHADELGELGLGWIVRR